ncbi:uncharacterized protein YwkD-like [Benincasa hispida]|uniref:uncharacterized protein YwkD-like n=1 Tax=Benincasa hispida TaxID=102211 RepID=UPI00190102A5|nr:uncharacterized protein YwkD-like [Benincasa hispida]
MKNPLLLKSVNHISIVCNSLEKSLEFYQKVLGFYPIKRPTSFTFHGAWLYNYGIGIHLLQSDEPDNMPKKRVIKPKDNHLSFQSENMAITEKQLKEMRIEYVKCEVEDDGIFIDQLFFHDPDGLMIEVCNCENLPVMPVSGGGDSLPPPPPMQLVCGVFNKMSKNKSYSKFKTAPFRGCSSNNFSSTSHEN